MKENPINPTDKEKSVGKVRPSLKKGNTATSKSALTRVDVFRRLVILVVVGIVSMAIVAIVTGYTGRSLVILSLTMLFTLKILMRALEKESLLKPFRESGALEIPKYLRPDKAGVPKLPKTYAAVVKSIIRKK